MTNYIEKNVLVAEINRLIKNPILYKSENVETRISVLEHLLSFLATLEVKDVDLEKEFDNYAKNILACDVQFEPFTHLYNCAKYFYKLGLKTRKGE